MLAAEGCSRHFDLVVTNVVLHEAAHFFGQYDDPCAADETDDEPSPPETIPTVAAKSREQRERESALLNAACFAASPPDPAWTCAGHGPDFIRAALHIGARALQAGVATCAELMFVRTDGWSSPAAYLDALGGETDRRINEPLRTVLADDPPTAFTRLADADRAAQTDTDKAAA